MIIKVDTEEDLYELINIGEELKYNVPYWSWSNDHFYIGIKRLFRYKKILFINLKQSWARDDAEYEDSCVLFSELKATICII